MFTLELNCGTNIGAKKDQVLTADVIAALDVRMGEQTSVLVDKVFLDDDENTVFLRFEWPAFVCTELGLTMLANSLCYALGQAAIPLQCLENGVQVMGVCEANKPKVWRDEWSQFNADYFQVPCNIDLNAA